MNVQVEFVDAGTAVGILRCGVPVGRNRVSGEVYAGFPAVVSWIAQAVLPDRWGSFDDGE